MHCESNKRIQHNKIWEYLEKQTTNEKVEETTVPLRTPLPTTESQINCASVINNYIDKRVSSVSETSVRKENETPSETNSIPNSHVIIQKRKLGLLKAKADCFDKILNALSQHQYVGSDVGDSMISLAASLVPQCGYAGLSSVIPLAIGSVFATAGVPIDHMKVIDSQPSYNHIKNSCGASSS